MVSRSRYFCHCHCRIRVALASITRQQSQIMFYAGCLATTCPLRTPVPVPIDLITSPIQLINWISVWRPLNAWSSIDLSWYNYGITMVYGIIVFIYYLVKQLNRGALAYFFSYRFFAPSLFKKNISSYFKAPKM